jgi:hypothetical protein
MALTHFQNNLRFALRKETPDIRSTIPLNRAEQIGGWLSWLAYEFRFVFVKSVFDPRFVTICFTIATMIITALLFYPTDTWDILETSYEWILEHINWSYVRFGLWVVSEITIFGIGMRAFGRFSNRKLMEHHGIVS